MTTRRALWRQLVASTGVALVLSVGAAPAHADAPPYPYFHSTITTGATLPDGAGTVSLLYDDTMIITANVGHRIEVPGYSGESYLRIDPQGHLDVNLASPAYYLNADRFATSSLPATLQNTDVTTIPPQWERRALVNSQVVFHNHLIHWMSPTLPEVVRDDGWVRDWSVTITVDGTPWTVRGVVRVDLAVAEAMGADFSKTTVVDARGTILRGPRHRAMSDATLVALWSAVAGLVVLAVVSTAMVVRMRASSPAPPSS